MRPFILVSFLMMTPFAVATGGDHKNCPMHQEKSEEHHRAVNSRGDHAMGFDHTKTTHHFRIQEEGGVIEVTANDPSDIASRDAIRKHLSHIAVLFSDGDFNIPMFIHDRVPPGVPVLKEKKELITYKYEEIDRGGQIVISTADVSARNAVHEFLRFQINDHRTEDPHHP